MSRSDSQAPYIGLADATQGQSETRPPVYVRTGEVVSRGAVEAGDGAAEAGRGAVARRRAERDGEEQQERPDEGNPRSHRRSAWTRKAGASTVETTCSLSLNASCRGYL